MILCYADACDRRVYASGSGAFTVVTVMVKDVAGEHVEVCLYFKPAHPFPESGGGNLF